ncbi:MAG: hypothetical protein EAZ67_04375 [Cytophagales bacterium]|nr:MAG: hypothetical protein EAZ67_04375 [Cytophagales bacterium]
MAKLKHVIKQLTDSDYRAICELLIESNAEKSALLLTALRERQSTDAKIMQDLEVNTNAYYTLRSRLNQRIEEYLLEQMETPRTDLLRKILNIADVIFTKPRAIATASLRKLERELLDYDLSSELIMVYKNLKKLHVNSPDYYTYSQLYNKHVAFTLAVDKAEDILSEYFKRFGIYTLSNEPEDKQSLCLLSDEMISVAKLYESHRLYVYNSLLTVFHRLFVIGDENAPKSSEPIEDILAKTGKILASFPLDPIYHHLSLPLEYLKLEYYNHYGIFRKSDKSYEELHDSIPYLVSNFAWFSFPPRVFLSRLERAIRLQIADTLEAENEHTFDDIDIPDEDVPYMVHYYTYRAISCHYAGEYEKGAKWINDLFNRASLKKYPLLYTELKSILALQYCLANDNELYTQVISSTQRQIRIYGKADCEHVHNFVKIMKIMTSDSKKDKTNKIMSIANRNIYKGPNLFTPTQLIKFDERIIAIGSKTRLTHTDLEDTDTDL